MDPAVALAQNISCHVLVSQSTRLPRLLAAATHRPPESSPHRGCSARSYMRLLSVLIAAGRPMSLDTCVTATHRGAACTIAPASAMLPKIRFCCSRLALRCGYRGVSCMRTQSRATGAAPG